MSILDAANPSPSAPNNLELIRAIGTKFIARKDVKAMQGDDGRWYTVTSNRRADGDRLPFTMDDFNDHLAGRHTYGHYLLDSESRCKFFAYDIDLDATGTYVTMTEDVLNTDWIECEPRAAWRDPNHPAIPWLRTQLRCMAEGLALRISRVLGIPVAVADSGGKGLHVYGFTGLAPASDVRELGKGIIDAWGCFEPHRGENFYKHKFGQYPNLTIEVFPKQDSLDGKDLGNLMALPLGVHRGSGRPRTFLQLKNGYDQPWIQMDPMRALDGDLPWE